MTDRLSFLVPSPEQLGPILRGFRKSKGLTQAELASRTGMRQKTISSLETAPSRSSVDTLMRYLAALGTELHLTEKMSPETSRDVAENW